MSGPATTTPSLRNPGFTLYTQAALPIPDRTPPWPESPGGTDEPPGPDPHGENVDPADNTTSPVPTVQRKLPIPQTGANLNTNLKGILIKPKRILPAQPDSLRVKRVPQDAGPQLKSQATDGQNSQTGTSNSNQDVKDLAEISPKQTKLPKLQIDVDRLKTYFLSNNNEGTDVKRPLVNESEPGIKKSATLRSHGHSGYTPHTYCGRDNTHYNFSHDRLSHVRDWCSKGEMNKMTAKMASDPALIKDRNIRSPSPKSNTTWDRSSSGYSSDERADPRSPPPRETASAISKPEINIEDDGYCVSESRCDKEDTVAVAVLEKEESAISELSSCNVDEVNGINSDNVAGEVTIVGCNECSSNVTCSCTTSEGANNVDKTDQNQNNVSSKNDTTITVGSNVSIYDNSLGQKQTSRRPAWPLAVPPASGRIQYRKSGSESVISLRHPSRQSVNSDNNSFEGLEVCGKSYPQVPNTTAKYDVLLVESARAEGVAKSDSNISSSAFLPLEKLTPTPSETLNELVPTSETIKQDSAFRTRIMRQQLVPPRSPRDIKSLSLSLAGKLTIARDDKDIRKTLHDLNSPRRSPCGKTAPIRARHIIHPTSGNSNQPMSTTDTAASQPMGLAFTSFQRGNSNSDGKQTLKYFGKKMWRQPQGQPENAQMRPFSPFGGTLPPSKIQENEQRLHDHDS